jgi:CBS domain-containing protein
MLKARDIMTSEVITITPETEIVQAAKLMLDNSINGLPVVDDGGHLVGVICQSDLVAQQKDLPMPSIFSVLDAYFPLTSSKHIEHELQKIAAITVAQAMTPHPVAVGPETGLDEIAELMVDKKYHTLPVLDGEELVGIVGKEDVLRTITAGEGNA